MTTIAAVLFIALTLWLGNWQLNRAEEKRARQALMEARMNDTPLRLTGAVASAEPLLYRRVRAAGRWIAARQVFVDNRIHDGRAGFHVVTPLEIEGTRDVVLVNRGWIARSAAYPRAPEAPAPEGRVEVSGLAVRPPARVLELSPETVAGEVWQNLSIERYASRTGLTVVPVVVLQDAPAPGLAAVREVPDAGIAKHHEYAFTWFSLAALAAGLWLGLNLKRVR
jgi:surfeit locus 1 family protein